LGFEANDLRVLARNELEKNLIEIGQAVALLILFPVVRVSFKSDLLAGNIFLQTKRAHAGELPWRCRHIPFLREPTLPVCILEPMFRQHRNVVEYPLGRSVGLLEIKTDRVVINLSNRQRFPPHDQEVPLRRMNIPVEIHLETEHNVIRAEGTAV